MSFIRLDPTQRTIAHLPASKSVLIHGPAGCGKTTAALHRLVSLQSRVPPHRLLLLTPDEELAHDARARLDGLGARQVEVAPVHQWVANRSRRMFRHLPEEDSRDAGPRAIAFKRHPAVLEGLELLACERSCRTSMWDLLHLWGDRGLLDEIIDASDGELNASAAAEVERRVRLQFSALPDEGSDTLDEPIALGMDGRPTTWGTPDHDAGSLDLEDHPVLFALHHLRMGRLRGLQVYSHIVVDEAQDVGPLELGVIRRACGGGITAVGDAHQQTDASAWFRGWDATGEALQLADRLELGGSYRCLPEIVALATRAREGALTAEDAPGFDSTAELRGTVREVIARGGAVICDPSSLGAMREHLPDGVTPFTVEQVKGREFPEVLVPDLLHWPTDARGRRRLYVALTRSRGAVRLGRLP